MTGKKRAGMAVGISALALFIVAAVFAGKAVEHKSFKECCSGKHHMMCPVKIEGAEVKVVNTDNGVTIHVTAKDPKVVDKIQEAAISMMEKGSCQKHKGKEAGYICPMGAECYKGPGTKNGLCPKCGMKLKMKKPEKGCKCGHNKLDNEK